MKHTIATTLAALGSAGLPPPVPEHPFAPPRQWRADWAWPDQMLLWEIEGGTWKPGGGRHNRAAGYEADARKYNAAAVRGWRIIRTTGAMVESGEALAVLTDALARIEP